MFCGPFLLAGDLCAFELIYLQPGFSMQTARDSTFTAVPLKGYCLLSCPSKVCSELVCQSPKTPKGVFLSWMFSGGTDLERDPSALDGFVKQALQSA